MYLLAVVMRLHPVKSPEKSLAVSAIQRCLDADSDSMKRRGLLSISKERPLDGKRAAIACRA